jgi:uncharacterized membrane protein
VSNDYIKLRSALKTLAESVTILGAIIYVTGFVIVNSYFLSYGYTVTPLFRVRYLSAGLLFAALCFLIAFGMFPVYWAYRKSQESPPVTSSELTWGLFGGLGIFFYVFKRIIEGIITDDIRGEGVNSYQNIHTAALIVIVALLIFEVINAKRQWFPRLASVNGLAAAVFFLLLFIGSVDLQALQFVGGAVGVVGILGILKLKEWEPDKWITIDPVNNAYILAAGVGCAFFTISTFSTYFYPFVKPQFGGGQLSRVRVILNDDAIDQVAKLGFPKDPTQLLSDAQLLDSSDNEFLIVVKSSQSDRGVLLQLERHMVDTVMYLSPP